MVIAFNNTPIDQPMVAGFEFIGHDGDHGSTLIILPVKCTHMCCMVCFFAAHWTVQTVMWKPHSLCYQWKHFPACLKRGTRRCVSKISHGGTRSSIVVQFWNKSSKNVPVCLTIVPIWFVGQNGHHIFPETDVMFGSTQPAVQKIFISYSK